MLGVDESGDAAGFLSFGDGVQGQGGLAAAFRSEHFDDASAREAADAQSHVHGQDAGRDHVDFRVVPLAQEHDRTVAELGADVVERLFEDVFAGQLFAFLCFSQNKLLLFIKSVVFRKR